MTMPSSGGGSGGSADIASATSSASNVFGQIGGLSDNLVALVGVALLVVVALIVVGRK